LIFQNVSQQYLNRDYSSLEKYTGQLKQFEYNNHRLILKKTCPYNSSIILTHQVCIQINFRVVVDWLLDDKEGWVNRLRQRQTGVVAPECIERGGQILVCVGFGNRYRLHGE